MNLILINYKIKKIKNKNKKVNHIRSEERRVGKECQ